MVTWAPRDAKRNESRPNPAVASIIIGVLPARRPIAFAKSWPRPPPNRSRCATEPSTKSTRNTAAARFKLYSFSILDEHHAHVAQAIQLFWLNRSPILSRDKTTRLAQQPCCTVLGRRRPKTFNSPCTSFAKSIVLFSNALRVLSKASHPFRASKRWFELSRIRGV